MNRKPVPKTGLAHLLAATGYSLAGLKVLTREPSFRQEIIAGLLGFGLLIGFDAELASIAIFAVLLCILMAIEAINTALEAVVDHLSPDWSTFGKRVKDLGSAAVFMMIAANLLFFVATLIPLLRD